MTSNKKTGFMISFGTDNPFEPDDPIIGGANKQITCKPTLQGATSTTDKHPELSKVTVVNDLRFQ